MDKHKVLTFADLKKLHVEKFGFEPVITGANFWESDKTPERIMEAIEKGVPYIEKEVPPGVLI
jgi:hypothetical protein